MDTIYWAALYDEGTGIKLLDDMARIELELFIEKKMAQLKAYKEECTVRFS